jgi:Ca-activated chloride channel family protein
LAKKQTSEYNNNECQYIGSKGYEISLILDASGSMRKSNKFGIVKKILVDFIKQRKTDKLALSIFADFA